ncbi:hypothetical protein VNO78_34667 [Psophocarpus tetragonolobus]|uniref:Uncharacterized protein n=1 Tax=Psophocarpus tetragonolobus TaxID=3891 RepID=A0AAN9RRD2_PSOTE
MQIILKLINAFDKRPYDFASSFCSKSKFLSIFWLPLSLRWDSLNFGHSDMKSSFLSPHILGDKAQKEVGPIPLVKRFSAFPVLGRKRVTLDWIRFDDSYRKEYKNRKAEQSKEE